MKTMGHPYIRAYPQGGVKYSFTQKKKKKKKKERKGKTSPF
jgi:hypothetical protein